MRRARIDHEALEAEGPRVPEWRKVVEVARYQATPESNIDVNAAMRGGSFLLERHHCDRGGDVVQRHVDERRDSTGGRRLRGRFKALQFRARLGDMRVRIDQARHQHGVAVDHHLSATGEPGIYRPDRADAPVDDADRACDLIAPAGDGPGGADDELELFSHARSQRLGLPPSASSRAALWRAGSERPGRL